MVLDPFDNRELLATQSVHLALKEIDPPGITAPYAEQWRQEICLGVADFNETFTIQVLHTTCEHNKECGSTGELAMWAGSGGRM